MAKKKKTQKKKKTRKDSRKNSSGKLLHFPGNSPEKKNQFGPNARNLNKDIFLQHIGAYYLNDVDSDTLSQIEITSKFEEMVSGTGYLIDEPEMQDVIVNPENAVQIYQEADKCITAKYGNPETLSEEEFDHVSAELIMKMGNLALEQGTKSDIQLGLLDVMARGLRSKNKKLVADASLNLFILREDSFKEEWSALPVVCGVIDRSLETLDNFSDALSSIVSISDGESEELNTDAMDKLEELISSSPGLKNYIDNEFQEPWLLGLEAIADGDLEFEISNDEELAFTGEVMKMFPPEIVNFIAIEEQSDLMDRFVEYLDDTIIPHFERSATPDRIDVIRKKAQEHIKELDEEDQYHRFFQILITEMDSSQPESAAAYILWNASLAACNETSIDEY